MLYTYKMRPEYNSKNLLLEFSQGVENENFISDLINELSVFEMKIFDIADLWMNDEVIMNLNSNIGNFILSKDIWGLAFILSDVNQEGIIKIDSILSKSNKFNRQ